MSEVKYDTVIYMYKAKVKTLQWDFNNSEMYVHFEEGKKDKAPIMCCKTL